MQVLTPGGETLIDYLPVSSFDLLLAYSDELYCFSLMYTLNMSDANQSLVYSIATHFSCIEIHLERKSNAFLSPPW